MVSYFNGRKFLKHFLYFALLFLIFGCSKHPLILQQVSPKTIFFSTKDFRFFDTGFIKQYPDKTILEIFSAGHLFFWFSSTSNQVCVNGQCYAKDSMIRRFFGDDSLRELDFQSVLLGNEIFNGENKIFMDNGFKQVVRRADFEIVYEVLEYKITFKEHKSNFILEIESLPNQ